MWQHTKHHDGEWRILAAWAGLLSFMSTAVMSGCVATEVKYQIVVDREFATEPVLETAVFQSGEKFRMQIEPEQDCHVYLFNRGTSGRYHVLFPIPQVLDGRNELTEDRAIMIPGNGSYQFDTQTGSEELVLCVSRRAYPDLERLVRTDSADTHTVDALLLKIEQMNRDHSSYVKTIDQDSTRVCLVSRRPEAVLVSRIVLRHRPMETTPLASHPTMRAVRQETSQGDTRNPLQRETGTAESGLAGSTGSMETPPSYLSGSGEVSLLDAVRRGWIQVSPRGNGLNSVLMEMERQNDSLNRVIVPVGTYFATMGNSQNMISTQPVTVDFKGTDRCSVDISAACADLNRPQPTNDIRFHVQELRDPVLRRLLQKIETSPVSDVVAQVAIWVVTDDVSRSTLNQVYRHTRYVNGVLSGQSPAASDADIAAAKQLLEDIGFNTIHARLFH